MPGKVKVKVVSGRNLPVMDRSNDTTDAFVELKLGGTTHKTDVCRKSLNPQWDSEWFRFEMDDLELQDEPLQVRLMDYDTYSANDAIGKVYLDLNPLLVSNAKGKSDAAIKMISGWLPVYDTMHGIRGEVNLIVKVELFSDFNKYRESSCGVKFFFTQAIPEMYTGKIIHGFVEELVVNDDPEYQWIDKIRTPRASNEARQTLFSKLSGEVQRRIGLKALEMGGNAVIGYKQCFDLEGESGIVVRAIGTAATLTKHTENQVSPTYGYVDPTKECSIEPSGRIYGKMNRSPKIGKKMQHIKRRTQKTPSILAIKNLEKGEKRFEPSNDKTDDGMRKAKISREEILPNQSRSSDNYGSSDTNLTQIEVIPATPLKNMDRSELGCAFASSSLDENEIQPKPFAELKSAHVPLDSTTSLSQDEGCSYRDGNIGEPETDSSDRNELFNNFGKLNLSSQGKRKQAILRKKSSYRRGDRFSKSSLVNRVSDDSSSGKGYIIGSSERIKEEILKFLKSKNPESDDLSIGTGTKYRAPKKPYAKNGNNACVYRNGRFFFRRKRSNAMVLAMKSSRRQRGLSITRSISESRSLEFTSQESVMTVSSEPALDDSTSESNCSGAILKSNSSLLLNEKLKWITSQDKQTLSSLPKSHVHKILEELGFGTDKPLKLYISSIDALLVYDPLEGIAKCDRCDAGVFNSPAHASASIVSVEPASPSYYHEKSFMVAGCSRSDLRDSWISSATCDERNATASSLSDSRTYDHNFSSVSLSLKKFPFSQEDVDTVKYTRDFTEIGNSDVKFQNRSERKKCAKSWGKDVGLKFLSRFKSPKSKTHNVLSDSTPMTSTMSSIVESKHFREEKPNCKINEIVRAKTDADFDKDGMGSEAKLKSTISKQIVNDRKDAKSCNLIKSSDEKVQVSSSTTIMKPKLTPKIPEISCFPAIPGNLQSARPFGGSMGIHTCGSLQNAVGQQPCSEFSNRRSSDSDLSTPTRGSRACVRTGGNCGVFMDPIDMMEYPFITLCQFPEGFLQYIGGTVTTRSVKLMERITNPDEPETRDAWWNEIRKEIRSHCRAFGCNVVIDYEEKTAMCDDVCILSASGTAAILHPSVYEISSQSVKASSKDKLDREKMEDKLSNCHIQGSDGGQHGRNEFENPCLVLHVPPGLAVTSGSSIEVTRCFSCRNGKVPEILLVTIDLPDYLETNGQSCLVQAQVCRPKKDCKGELVAKEVSDSLPFLEYELHRRLLNKLKVKGMNSIFGLKVQISLGEKFMVGVATGTAVYLNALAPPTVPIITAGSLKSDAQKVSQFQKVILEANERNKEYYHIRNFAEESDDNKQGSADGDDSDDDIIYNDLSSSHKATYMLEVDDSEDVDIISVLIDPIPPDGFYMNNIEFLHSFNNCRVVSQQMFIQVWRCRIPSLSLRQFTLHFEKLIRSICFKLRRMKPCVLSKLQYNIELPEPDELHISIIGMAVGISESDYLATISSSFNVTGQRTKGVKNPTTVDEGDMIFNMEDDSRLASSECSALLRKRESTPCKVSSETSSGGHFLDAPGSSTTPKRTTSSNGDKPQVPSPIPSPSLSVSANLLNQYSNVSRFAMRSSSVAGITLHVRMRKAHRSKLFRDFSRTDSLLQSYNSLMALRALTGVSKFKSTVEVTPLSYIHGARIDKYLGNLNFFFIRETTSMRESGGLSGFVHSFIAEVLAILRAHVVALGGNAIVSYFNTELALLHNPHKNQGQCLINVGGDVVYAVAEEDA